MAEITAALGRHGISIASVIQHESEGKLQGIVPLVIMTHKTTEGATRRAVEEIDGLACTRPGSERIRVSE
jgi:homoserine dehydrogenase